MKIKQIFKEQKEKKVTIKGWVISVRGNNNVRFVVFNDGSTFKNIQVVLKDENATSFDKVGSGSAVEFTGVIKLTPNSKQPLELIADEVKIFQNVGEDFPIQKQGMSKEVLREIPHLRHRTNLFRAVMRVRSTLFLEIHNFFNKENFLYVSSPILTSNDGEGAGESFVVDSEDGNFFNKKAMLGVTGQLQAESYANGFGNVYAFGPTFRAENSNTQKHAAEFWMLEPELAFTSKDELIEFTDKLLKTVISKTVELLPDEFDFFEKHVDTNILKKIDNIIKTKITKIKYKDAIKKLQEVGNIFEENNIVFGTDLATEHEKYLAEKIFKGPVAITDYPKNIKAFYMKQNDDNETVAAFDILFPGIGEVVGGSERECDYNKLMNRIKEMNMDVKEIQWYVDLRKFGHHQSSGFGLGFERLIMYITGIENIRDVIPYPRTPGNLKM